MAESSPITLDEVNAAIRAVTVGGQAYRLPDGTMVTRGDLGRLMELRDALRADDRAASGGTYVRVAFGEAS